ncbi:MAG: dCTP deaminase domain-containing protein [Ilumatobacteraceae bacterium]
MLDDGGLALRTVGEIVKEPRACSVVAFDPDSFEVGYHRVTGTFEGPADRIYEVRLGSGRSVHVTAGHNLFTLDRDGEIRKIRTGELAVGVQVAVPRSVPEPPSTVTDLDLLDLLPDGERAHLRISGPTIAIAHRAHRREVASLLASMGFATSYYRRRDCLPWSIAAQIPHLIARLTPADRLHRRTERHSLPSTITVDEELAWLLGMYVAEGYRRANQVVISNTDQARLDRLQTTVRRLGLPVYRSTGAVTCCSRLLSDVVGWLGTGGCAPTKRVPPIVFGWPDALVRSFLDGLVDGNGSVGGGRTSVWTTSAGLADDVLLLFARLGRRAAWTCKTTANLPLFQVYAPDGEHKLLTSVPLPDRLLTRARHDAALSQVEAARLAGYRHPSDLNNIEGRRGRDAVRFSTLRRLADAYGARLSTDGVANRLRRLTDGGLAWDRVVEVVDTGRIEPVYDLEVRPAGRKIENFLAGAGGVFVANTAGFVDSGFRGHITLELANVASLPITLYPGMKIGQLSFMRMTTPADRPYGKGATGSKYQGQRGPTPSRYFQNFE